MRVSDCLHIRMRMPSASGGRKKILNLLELELQDSAGSPLGARNGIRARTREVSALHHRAISPARGLVVL